MESRQKEAIMSDDPNDDQIRRWLGEGDEMNAEAWLQSLLALTGDKDRREWLYTQLTGRTKLPREKVEEIIAVMMNILANRSRSN
jgi:hypothetical protein